jgi:hypothetical protein
VLRRPQVTAAINGATRVEQLEQNLKALEVKLSDAEWREVEAAIAGGPATNGKPAGPARSGIAVKPARTAARPARAAAGRGASSRAAAAKPARSGRRARSRA